jgi:hypothetical protein
VIPVVGEIAFGAKVIGFFKKVQTWLYAVLAVAALLGLGLYLHGRAVKRAHDAAYSEGYAAGGSDNEKAHVSAQAKAESAAAAINNKIRKQADEKAGSIARTADDMQLRGPGKAACPRLAAAPTSAGQPVPPAGPGNAAVDQVPDAAGQQLIALPLNDTIRFAGQCDLNRDEAARWRQADAQQSTVGATTP